MFFQERYKRFLAHRLREVITLYVIAADSLQDLILFPGLDTFSDDAESVLMHHLNGAPDHRFSLRCLHLVDDALVNLHQTQRKLDGALDIGISGSEIIQGECKPLLTQFCDILQSDLRLYTCG